MTRRLWIGGVLRCRCSRSEMGTPDRPGHRPVTPERLDCPPGSSRCWPRTREEWAGAGAPLPARDGLRLRHRPARTSFALIALELRAAAWLCQQSSLPWWRRQLFPANTARTADGAVAVYFEGRRGDHLTSGAARPCELRAARRPRRHRGVALSWQTAPRRCHADAASDDSAVGKSRSATCCACALVRRFPSMDGRARAGGHVDEVMVTGEFLPVAKTVGSGSRPAR